MATNATTFNRELLIVEKESDGKPFALHTSHEDVASYYRSLRSPYLTLAILFGVMGIATQSLVFGMIGLASFVPVIIYQLQIVKSEREAKTAEW